MDREGKSNHWRASVGPRSLTAASHRPPGAAHAALPLPRVSTVAQPEEPGESALGGQDSELRRHAPHGGTFSMRQVLDRPNMGKRSARIGSPLSGLLYSPSGWRVFLTHRCRNDDSSACLRSPCHRARAPSSPPKPNRVAAARTFHREASFSSAILERYFSNARRCVALQPSYTSLLIW